MLLLLLERKIEDVGENTRSKLLSVKTIVLMLLSRYKYIGRKNGVDVVDNDSGKNEVGKMKDKMLSLLL